MRQGTTLNHAGIDLVSSIVYSKDKTYVALSQVRSLDRLIQYLKLPLVRNNLHKNNSVNEVKITKFAFLQ